MFHRIRKNRAFSLIELVVVLVIIGVIAAIAIPRMSRGANNAGGVALRGDLQVLRSAIELYRAEHEGRLPTLASFVDQMTKYTKIDGTDANDAFDAATGRIYGPYLTEIPTLPVGTNKGLSAVEAAQSATSGWVYDASTGKVIAGSPDADTDQDGTKYNAY
ncbi:MAG: prepilin-type N-terminal cleavage/methylation domain-containing protein [Phycisphaeraceae bacterium]|nr:prepilin-type N-terminal cleavage/methylation domain-containing protein [Phycisphaerales bacterium]MCB9860468.1 prepilin-type N-terminal cleavage/methylation domain-containing protein [Phycisphaeraceae bacterium]